MLLKDFVLGCDIKGELYILYVNVVVKFVFFRLIFFLFDYLDFWLGSGFCVSGELEMLYCLGDSGFSMLRYEVKFSL